MFTANRWKKVTEQNCVLENKFHNTKTLDLPGVDTQRSEGSSRSGDAGHLISNLLLWSELLYLDKMKS